MTRPVPSLRRLSPSTTVASAGGTLRRLKVDDDRDRVGGRDHRPDDEREVEPQSRRQVEEHGDDRGRDHDPRHRQQGQATGRPSQMADLEPVGGLEHEAREQDRKDDLGRDLGRLGDPDQRRAETGQETHEDERDRVGQPDRTSDDRHDGGDPEQRHEQPDRAEDRGPVHDPKTTRRDRRSGGRCPSGARLGPGLRPSSGGWFDRSPGRTVTAVGVRRGHRRDAAPHREHRQLATALGQPAGGLLALTDVEQRGLLDPAPVEGERAARMEAAAGRDGRRVRASRP